MEIHEQIKFRREELKLSQLDLAKKIGTTQQNIARIESGEVKHSRFFLDVLAALGLPYPDPKGRKFAPSVIEGNFRPPAEFLGLRDLPVFSAVEGGPGEMVISTDPIDFVPRPWFLNRVKEGYAVLVTGESMMPVFEPGDMAIVNPRIPVLKGKDAIFVAQEHDGDFKATLKRYLGSVKDHWLAQQFNPPHGQQAELRLPKKIWIKAVRVVGRYSGF